MLKLILAQLGITIDQATVDKTIGDIGTALASVQAMKESQDRCEAMLMDIVANARATREAQLVPTPGPAPTLGFTPDTFRTHVNAMTMNVAAQEDSANESDYPDNTVNANITITDKVVLGKPAP